MLRMTSPRNPLSPTRMLAPSPSTKYWIPSSRAAVHGPCQIIGGCCIVEEIGRTTDPECGVLSKRLIALEPLGV